MGAFLTSPGDFDILVEWSVTLPNCTSLDTDCSGSTDTDLDIYHCLGQDPPNFSTSKTISGTARLRRGHFDPMYHKVNVLECEFSGIPPCTTVADGTANLVARSYCDNIWTWYGDIDMSGYTTDQGSIDITNDQNTIVISSPCDDNPIAWLDESRIIIACWPLRYDVESWEGESNRFWQCEANNLPEITGRPLTANAIDCGAWTLDISASSLFEGGVGGHLFWGEVPSVNGLPDGTAYEVDGYDGDFFDAIPGVSSWAQRTITRNRTRHALPGSASITVTPVSADCQDYDYEVECVEIGGGGGGGAGGGGGLASQKAIHCPHLGDSTGGNVEMIGCRSCNGLTTTSVWTCNLHELCAPLARVPELNDKSVRACNFCSDKPPLQRGQRLLVPNKRLALPTLVGRA